MGNKLDFDSFEEGLVLCCQCEEGLVQTHFLNLRCTAVSDFNSWYQRTHCPFC